MILKRALILLTLLLAGCSQSFYGSGRKLLEQGRYESAVDAFYKEIAANPQNAAAWRELGVTYYRMQDFLKAEDALKQANAIVPDARTHLFLGLIYEKQNEYEKAIDAYAASLNLDPSKQTREKVTAHLDQLVYKKISQDVSLALENEAEIETDTIPENTVAVVNFDGSHLQPDLAPLAVGLAEFTSSDLAKVKSLNTVERLKVDAIIDELKLSQTGYVDPASAPRVGKLLGTSRIITGSLLGIGDDGFRLDGVIVGATDTTKQFTEANEGRLREMFDVQKKFVFDILDSLGVTLTIEERDAIREIPTESYLAFLAYSRGLYFEQQGMHEQARQEFNTAVGHDANFSAAQVGMTKATAAVASGGYSESQQALESFAVSAKADLEAVAGGLDSRLNATLLNSGIIPDINLTNLATVPLHGTGRVVITVDLEQ
ncbi:MAG: tetratricopeptide repeat protein [Candidatus Zixiibacteriota bacterium]|nr:MAG: tetratricopeptide repeat protein [candidate division Zixibacteria bacterium]